ncbi:MAG: ABC transporter permease [Myxococcota bacterium]|nr:ABC transporter permease [Myxococcota bacterium]
MRLIARLPGVLGVMLGASLLVSATLRMVPGDPVTLILGEQATESDRARLEDRLGLNRSFGEQYLKFLGDVISGELQSYRSEQTVFKAIAVALPQTLILSILALLLSASLGLSLGIAAALHRGTWIDAGALFFASIGLATPRIWLGPMLLLIFAVQFDLFPVGGNEGWLSLVLPVLSLGTAMAAMLARMTRSSLLEVLGMDYIRTARAKGLSERVVVGRHALRNALIPVITILGLQLGSLLAGAVVTEKIFNWPGIGTLLLKAIQTMDFPMVQGCILMIAGVYVLTNLMVDIIYELTDPRMRT